MDANASRLWTRTLDEKGSAMTTGRYEFGLDTFGDVTIGADGALLSHAQTLRNLVEEAELADRLGLDFFGVGEHHRHEFSVSAPERFSASVSKTT